MTKRVINITLNIPDALAPVITKNLDVLKHNERISDYLSTTVLEKLQDTKAIEELNQKIKFSSYGSMQSTEMFYNAVLERQKALEEQIEALRYDMHTAAVLSEQVMYKELSAKIMSTIDVLFRNLTIDIKLNVSDYVEQRKWLELETALQDKFAKSLSNFRMIQSIFDDDIELSEEDTLSSTTEDVPNPPDAQDAPDTPDTPSADSNNEALLLEKMEQLLKEMDDIKYALRNSSVMDEATIRRNIQFSGTEIAQPATPAQPAQPATPTQPAPTQTEPIQQQQQTSTAGVVSASEDTPSLEDLDLTALAGFFM